MLTVGFILAMQAISVPLPPDTALAQSSPSDSGVPNTAPVAYLTVNGSHSVTVNVGSTIHYHWASNNGVSFSSSYTSNNTAKCGSGGWLANSASGDTDSTISSNAGGCVWSATYRVTNSSGVTASDSITITVNNSASPTGSGSPTATATTPPSATPGAPSVSIVNPTNGTVFNSPATVPIQASVTGESISRVEFYYDNGLVFTDNSYPYQYDWPVTGANNGTHTFYAKAYNGGGSDSSAVTSLNVAIPTGGKLYGWAWSSNIGWIGFNCGQGAPTPSPGVTPTGLPGGCSVSSYGVTIDPDGSEVNGNMTGYAWSSEVGWLSFNKSDTASCGSQPAYVDLTTGKVVGWAKFILANTVTDDGWDGCLQLSDNTASAALHRDSPNVNGLHGVTLNLTTTPPKFNGFAWGGEVVGWVNFDVTTPIPGYPPPPGGSNGSTPPVNCPGCGGGGSAPSLTCVNGPAVKINSALSTGEVNVTVPAGVLQASGPSPYQFRWASGANLSSPSWSSWMNASPGDATANPILSKINISYPSNGSQGPVSYILQWQVKRTGDSDASVANTFTCGNVTVPPAQLPEIPLHIGKSAADANAYSASNPKNQFRARQGTPFALTWDIPERETGYGEEGLCFSEILDPNGKKYTHWDSELDRDTIFFNKFKEGLSTVGVPRGQYTFRVICARSDDPNNEVSSDYVNLIVGDTSVIEI